MAKWSIEINDFYGGESPNSGRSDAITYPQYVPGVNSINQSSNTSCVNLFSRYHLSPGYVGTDLTNGEKTGVVSTLATKFYKYGSNFYGIGGNLVYELTNTTVTSSGTWPHTIDKAAVTGETGSDVVVYKGNLYYTYAHSGSAGDIGKFDLSSTFDDDWGSTVPSGAGTLQSTDGGLGAYYPMVVGKNDTLYIGNGRYVASYDGTTLILQALDLPEGSLVYDLEWSQDALWIAVYQPDYSSSLYIWDGTTNSWISEIPINGERPVLQLFNGTIYVEYFNDGSGTNVIDRVENGNLIRVIDFGFNLGRVFHGQITTHNDHFIIAPYIDGSLWCAGPFNRTHPPRWFNLGSRYHATGDTWGAVINYDSDTLLCSYNDTSDTNNHIQSFEGYATTSSSWESLYFDVTGKGRSSKLSTIRINFDTLASGARFDWTLYNEKNHVVRTGEVSFSKQGAVTTELIELNGLILESLRLDISFANGSASVPVKIKNIKIYGESEE